MIIVQDTWIEEDDQELLEFMKDQKLNFQFKSREDILTLGNLPSLKVLFCDTDIMIELLQKRGISPLPTYPSYLQEFYKRPIVKSTVAQCLKQSRPFFIKPVHQKEFGGMLIETEIDYEYLKTFEPQQEFVIDSFKTCEGLGRIALLEGGSVVGIGKIISVERK